MVNTVSDDFVGPGLTLREAVFASNGTAEPDIISFLPGLIGVIHLDPLAGPIRSTGDITINGPGPGLLSVNSLTTSVFESTAGDLAVNGLTLAGSSPDDGGAIRFVSSGTLSVSNARFQGSVAADRGGAIFSTSGNPVSVSNSTLIENIADYGGAIYSTGGLTLTSSSVLLNSAGISGGGIHSSGQTSISDSTITENSAYIAGGIRVDGVADVTSSLVENNSADFAGGIDASGTRLNISGNSRISRNVAQESAGGIRGVGIDLEIVESEIIENSSYGNGGGIYAHTLATVDLTNVLVARNLAATTGAGVATLESNLLIENSEIVDNRDGGVAVSAGGGVHFDGGSLARILNITGGAIRGNSSDEGGGIYASSAQATITGTTISDNQSSGDGGGLMMQGGSLLMSDTVFLSNQATRSGGGAHLDDTNVIMNGNRFESNDSDLFGGGLKVGGEGDVTIHNSVFIENTASTGGGMSAFGAPLGRHDVTLANCNFISNFALHAGGGIHRTSLDDLLDMTNIRFEQNEAFFGTGGSAIDALGGFSLRDSVITGNTGGSSAIDTQSAADARYIESTTFDSNEGIAVFGTSGELHVLDSYLIDNDEGVEMFNGTALVVRGTTIRGSHHAVVSRGNPAHAGTLEVSHSVITGNTGLGISAISDVVVAAAEISNNQGGGISVSYDGSLDVNFSRIFGNETDREGGAIRFTATGPMDISYSTLYGNSAAESGGAVFISQAGDVDIVNSTISGNSAGASGGGLAIEETQVEIRHSTITENQADADNDGVGQGDGLSLNPPGPFADNSVTRLDHTIVAGNFGGSGSSDIYRSSILGAFLRLESTLIGNLDGEYFDDGGNLVGDSANPIDPLLSPLSENGGSTPTHAPQPGSPAIDGGSPAFSGYPLLDQRGRQRVTDGDRDGISVIDIGVVEPTPLFVDTLADEDDGNLQVGDLSLREALAVANLSPGHDFIGFADALQNQTIPLTMGELIVAGSVTIAGQVTIDAQGNSRIFSIDEGDDAVSRDVVLEGLTLTGGFSNVGGAISAREGLTLRDVTLTDNEALRGGAVFAVLSNGGKLVIEDSELSGNTATENFGGAISAVGGETEIANSTLSGNSGSAIYTNRQLTIHASTISHNQSQSTTGAGAILNVFGGVQISDSALENNVTHGGHGGAIRITNSQPLNIAGSSVSGNTATGYGGGIWTNGPATVSESDLLDNVATGPYAKGGAILSAENAPLTIQGGTLAGNVTRNGGAIFSFGPLTISDSKLFDNQATYGGGGAIYGLGETEIARSTISGNSALFGGGMQNASTLTIRDSTLAGNSASSNGGAINTSLADITIVNSTVSGNSAGGAGGGLHAYGPHATNVFYSTLTENTADSDDSGSGSGGAILVEGGGTVTIKHTIVAENTDNSGVAPDIGNEVFAVYSLIGNSQGAVITGGGNLVGTPAAPLNPLLRPLSNNGGPTLTHALENGSPAIDAGDVFFTPQSITPSLEFDQRGFDRVAGVIDIGAFERVELKASTAFDESDGNYATGDLSLREAIELANLVAGHDVIEFDSQLAGQTINLALGELSITDSLTINGWGADQLTLDARGNSRLFNIDDGDDSNILNVEIRGLTFTGGHADGEGGAVNSREDVLLADMIVASNTATSHGGGVYAYTPGGAQFVVERSVFAANTATSTFGDGGAIYVLNYGDVHIIDSTIKGNSAGRHGGGLRLLSNGNTAIDNSTFEDNQAGTDGGGIYLHNLLSGTATVTNSTISGNRANGNGGGMRTGRNTIIQLSTIASNTADYDGAGGGNGGGIYSALGNLSLDNSIVSGNDDRSGTTTTDDVAKPSAAGTIWASYSLVEQFPGSGVIAGGTSIYGLDPLLGPLADNGGLTMTRALMPGSPAIDAGGGGPVSLFRFEESGTANDTLRVNNGTFENGVNLNVSGPLPGLGGAARFDGVDDYVQLSQPLSVGASSQTIEVWVNVPLVGTDGLAPNEPVGVILGNFDGGT